MDPYLEDPMLWPGVHTAMIVYIRNQLQPRIRPRYYAAIEERVFLENAGDRQLIGDVRLRRGVKPTWQMESAAVAVAEVEADAPEVVKVPAFDIHEPYIEIRDRETGKRVVTLIEVVSPTNKYAGTGRDSYLAKQTEIRWSETHLVEIDLLRRGPHVVAAAERAVRGRYDYDYLVCVSRAKSPREDYELYPRKLRQPLPRVRIPLEAQDRDVVLDLQAVFNQVYDDAAYADRLRYDQPCQPPLSQADQEWADELTRPLRAPAP